MVLKDIDALIVEDLENPNHPSEFLALQEYELLIVRLVEIQEAIKIDSFAFIIANEEVYLYDREKTQLEKFGDLSSLAAFLDAKLELLIKEIQRYHIDIELLEDSLYEDSISDMFMQEWLHYKKDLSLIYRVMFHTAIAFELFLQHIKKKHSLQQLSLEDNLEHIKRISNLAFSAKEKLDNLYDFYRAKVDERMNRNMYYLTVISGIFLPLTLVTGFFGMNTGGLPFVNDSDGTIKVVLLSLVLEILLLVPFFLLNRKKIRKFQRRH